MMMLFVRTSGAIDKSILKLVDRLQIPSNLSKSTCPCFSNPLQTDAVKNKINKKSIKLYKE